MIGMKATEERKVPVSEYARLILEDRAYSDKVFLAGIYRFFSETLDQVATLGDEAAWLEMRCKVAPSFHDSISENEPNVSVCVEQSIRDVCRLVSTLPFDRLRDTATEFRQAAERIRISTNKPRALLLGEDTIGQLVRHPCNFGRFLRVVCGQLLRGQQRKELKKF